MIRPSKTDRLLMLGLLTLLLATTFVFAGTATSRVPGGNAIIFSALFLMSASVLLFEPFFTRPTDVIAASVSILLLLVPSARMLESWGIWYWVMIAYELASLIAAVLALLLLTETQGPGSMRNRLSYWLKSISTNAAGSKVQYFLLFFFALVFWVEPKSNAFIALAAYAGFVAFADPQRLALRIPTELRSRVGEIGTIFGVQGHGTFLVRLHPAAERPPVTASDLLEFVYGMDEPRRVRRALVLERFFLDQAQWIRVLCHEELDAQTRDLPEREQYRADAVYRVPGKDTKALLGTLIGVVREGTEIGAMRFLQAGDGNAYEGDLVEVGIAGTRVLYQVVNARVNEEALESRNVTDLVIGEAVQLGQWDPTRGTFDRFGWVPLGRTPVRKVRSLERPSIDPNDIELGVVPGTNLPVMLNPFEAVSHHTAILGVTGAGKSVFSRNLVRQFLDRGIYVIVVDFTREWKSFMNDRGAESLVPLDHAVDLYQNIEVVAEQMARYRDKRDKPTLDAALDVLKEGFRTSIREFLEGDNNLTVLELPDVSNTEATLEYTQWFFRMLFRAAREHNCYGKQVCIVLEEAHTVVPEWNFIGIAEKSAQALVNNISQIALQGRKYGVGFVVVAQRTASVSKTVLTQCNTIVAFQCFDGTSIEFLSHYLPRPTADALPHLRFRHAVAVGKAVRSTVPLIFEVPEIIETVQGPQPEGAQTGT